MNIFRRVPLSAGAYRAVLSSCGAGLAQLTFNGVDLVMPHDPQECPQGYSGQTLLPWPNRLRDGRYVWDSQLREFPCNDADTHTALHGLVAQSDWLLLASSDYAAVFGITVQATAAFPWVFTSTVYYELSPDSGLTISIRTRNDSHSPMPYGVSHHPYLMPGGGSVDDWIVYAPAASVYEADDQMIPIRKHDVETFDHDYRAGRNMRGVSVDHCFTDLSQEQWTVRVSSQQTGIATELHADTRWLQMYSADAIGRRGMAVEPMTCPPNALATGEGLVVIEPGQAHTFTMRINASF